MDICGFKIENVCNRPPSQIRSTSVPMFSHPCLHADDFNCQHTDWGYISSDGSTTLATSAAVDNLSLLYGPRDQQVFCLKVKGRRASLITHLRAPVVTSLQTCPCSPVSTPALTHNLYFVFSCIFILLSRENYQCAIPARLGVASHLATTPRWGNPAECHSQRHNK